MAPTGSIVTCVDLVTMRQLAEAKCAGDDWTGLKDQSERRRLQTRLALRSYRKRKSAQKAAKAHDRPQKEERLRATYAPEVLPECYPGKEALARHPSGIFIPPYRNTSGHIVSSRPLYPISRDHLVPIAEYNLFRAIQTNLQILGIKIKGSPCSFEGAITPFPQQFGNGSVPLTLRPTQLQQSTLYEEWIGILPSPRMRDNFIRCQHLFSVTDLCADLLGGLMGRENDFDAGILVWSDPWDPSGWEVTEGFLKKWGFLIEGCVDLFQSTNRWRYLRGEVPLFPELKQFVEEM